MDLQKIKTLRYFGKDILNGAITLNDAQEVQIQLKYRIYDFGNYTNKELKRKGIKQTYSSQSKWVFSWKKNAS